MVNRNIARVAVSDIVHFADKLFDYYIPDCFLNSAVVGARVLVPFGSYNRKVKGIILETANQSEYETLKPIANVLDSSPVLNDEFVSLIRFIRDRCFCTYYDAAKLMIPYGLNYSINQTVTALPYNDEDVNISALEQEVYDYINSADGKVTVKKLIEIFSENVKNILSTLKVKGLIEVNSVAKRNLGDMTTKLLSIALPDEQLKEYLEKNSKRRTKQYEVVETIFENGEISQKELCYMTGISASVVNNLIKKGILGCREEEVLRKPKIIKLSDANNDFSLNDEQKKVYDDIAAKTDGGYNVNLLYGVTGSGKTHVFLKLIDLVLKKGKTAIVLVPEISLTPQIVDRFINRYGNSVAIIHSSLSAGEKLDEWKRIKRGEIKIVVGTRSAIFAPLENIGIIIIDEEQEHTYKSEMTPKYNAKDVAKFRAKWHKATLLLASATPSVESYFLALGGRYFLHKINERYNTGPLPDILVADMRQELKNGNTSIISDLLRDEININLSKNEQTILFLNRRGFNYFISCRSCGHVVTCPNCNISLNYHSYNNRLMCHYCGFSIENTGICPECHENNLKYFGAGTQRVVAELEILFPGAKIARMDADTMIRKESHQKLISEFSKGEYDILVGTQMITKGLDFPDVTLVGVVSADLVLYADDYKANEKAFSLITQVVGRAGRLDKPGRAVIQTYSPENRVLNLAFTQDYEKFYDEEIKVRKSVIYPPFCDICMIAFQSENEVDLKASAVGFSRKIKELISGDEYKKMPLIGLGPSPAAVYKMNNQYRYKILLKCKINDKFREFISELIKAYHSDKSNKNVYISVDFNPEHII